MKQLVVAGVVRAGVRTVWAVLPEVPCPRCNRGQVFRHETPDGSVLSCDSCMFRKEIP